MNARFIILVVIASGIALYSAASAQAQVVYNPYVNRYAPAPVANPYVGGAAAVHNPYTGTTETGRAAYNPYTGASGREGTVHNPYTGTTAHGGGSPQSLHRHDRCLGNGSQSVHGRHDA